MAELVHREKEHFDWFPERSVYFYTPAKMDSSRSQDFIDFCVVEKIFKRKHFVVKEKLC